MSSQAIHPSSRIIRLVEFYLLIKNIILIFVIKNIYQPTTIFLLLSELTNLEFCACRNCFPGRL